MNCTQIHDLLLDSLDGSLTEPQQAAVDTHLSSCADCVRLLKQSVVTSQLLRRWDEADAADDSSAPALPEALVRGILAARAADEAARQRKRTTG